MADISQFTIGTEASCSDGAARQVAIPVSAVASTTDGIQLNTSRQQVQDLPPVNIDHP